MKEPPFLMSMNRIIGRIHIQNDLRLRPRMRIEKLMDHHLINRFRIHHDLLIALGCAGIGLGQFQPIQCALAGKRLAAVPALDPVLTFRIRLTHHHCKPKVGSQLVVIIQVLVAQTYRIRFLRQQVLNRMFDPLLFPIVGETFGKLLENSRSLLDFPQQQSTVVRTDIPTIEMTNHFTVT